MEYLIDKDENELANRISDIHIQCLKELRSKNNGKRCL